MSLLLQEVSRSHSAFVVILRLSLRSVQVEMAAIHAVVGVGGDVANVVVVSGVEQELVEEF